MVKAINPQYEVHLGDMLELDWSDADLVLANSTCFDQDLLNKIAQKCSLLKKGSWMFTLTKKLPSAEEDLVLEENGDTSSLSNSLVNENEWECVMSIKREMSWGLATVHIQRKIK
jgi:hypothetical protein